MSKDINYQLNLSKSNIERDYQRMRDERDALQTIVDDQRQKLMDRSHEQETLALKAVKEAKS